jgi:uncharacterized protein HemX
VNNSPSQVGGDEQVFKRRQLIDFAIFNLQSRHPVMKRLGVITAAVLSLLLGAPAFAYAPQEQQGEKQKQEQQDKKQGKQDQQRAQQQRQDKGKQDQQRAQQLSRGLPSRL